MTTLKSEGRDVAATLEDLTFLADHGVGASDAATRCGFHDRKHLDKWLRRHNQHALLAQLLHHDRQAA